ncbi:MAG: DUF4465 domain-containing protein [Bacteroidaceae bacterium]|nr:DUF4465 domain-containing protein [Bacteroidaceae bacterium]
MKQIKYLAFLLCAGMAVTACDNDDDEIAPSEQQQNTMTLTFEESKWASLIDNPQYYGPLLYGENAKSYAWTDETTQLHGGMTNAWGGMYGFSEGGIAISNYIDKDTDSPRSYDVQLAVPVSNGSKCFAIVYCEADLTFADGVAREIQSMDIIGTTYLCSVAKLGNEYAKALKNKGDYVNLVITAYNGEQQMGTSKVALAMQGGVLDKWFTQPLSALGKVTRLHFSMEGSDASFGYLNTPTYFAFDNVVVKK